MSCFIFLRECNLQAWHFLESQICRSSFLFIKFQTRFPSKVDYVSPPNFQIHSRMVVKMLGIWSNVKSNLAYDDYTSNWLDLFPQIKILIIYLVNNTIAPCTQFHVFMKISCSNTKISIVKSFGVNFSFLKFCKASHMQHNNNDYSHSFIYS